jgi:hypothetical protein
MSERVTCMCSSDCVHHRDVGKCNKPAVSPLPAWWKLGPGGSTEIPRGGVGICEECLAYQKHKVEGS